LKKLAEAFITAYQAKGRSPRSVEEIGRRLDCFLTYLESNGVTSVDRISREVMRAYQVSLSQTLSKKGAPLHIRTQNFMFSVAREFLRFLNENDYIVADPSAGIAYGKEPQSLPRGILTPAEVRKIIAAADTNCLTGYRNRAVLEVLYSTGIRRNELHNLTLEDVDYHDGFLRVNGKGGKERFVPLGRIACRYLENYIKSVRPQLIKNPFERHLFLSLNGRKFSTRVIIRFVKIYARKAGIRKKVSPHTFRHTCATQMLKNNANIRAVQELLGHASLSTTQIYTRITINDLKIVHQRCHPREKDRE
jgi:integrase/recombinase XerD